MRQKFKPKTNIIQRAYLVKKGELKLSDIPERKRDAVKNFSESIPLDQLQAMAQPAPKKAREVGQVPTRDFSKSVRSF